MELKTGLILEGKVTGVTKFGAFVDLGENRTGMVHISEIARSFVQDINDYVKVGDTVRVKILSMGEDGKIGLSIKKAMDPPPRRSAPRPPVQQVGRPDSFDWRSRDGRDADAMSFEDMLSKFKATSEDKISDLKRKNSDYSRGPKRGGPLK